MEPRPSRPQLPHPPSAVLTPSIGGFGLTELSAIEQLRFEDNAGLCAPADDAFRKWFDGVEYTTGDVCPTDPVSKDRAALVALYYATDGPNWTINANWLSDQPLDTWYGVTTDDSGRVTELALRDSGLSGHLPPEIGSLSNLTRLYLGANLLSGPIPGELGNLTNLWGLSLTDNRLTGTIPPELGGLTSLYALELNQNQLSGEIPAELGNLSNLSSLSLWSNRLSGTLPHSLTRLSAIGHLRFEDNAGLCAPADHAFRKWFDAVEYTSGGICPADSHPGDRAAIVALYNATDGPNWSINANWLSDQPLDTWYGVTTEEDGRVTELFLSVNRLRWEIPPEIGNLTNLTYLHLGENQLSGKIPAEIGSLTNLTELYLNNNQLSGEIPSEIGGLTNLFLLQLGGNQLSGEIPAEIGNLTDLIFLLIRGNRFGGTLPDSVTKLSAMKDLRFDDNAGLCAPANEFFQEWLDRLPSRRGDDCPPAPVSGDRAALAALYHATDGPNWRNNTNWLTDQPLHTWYGVTTDDSGRVTELSLRDNRLNGTIPPEIGSLSNLSVLALGANRLSGAIPSEIGSLTNLKLLGLGGNELSGAIPDELAGLSNLTELNLWGNHLSGEIPHELDRLSNLRSLALGHNRLSGQIPARLANLSNLAGLSLSENQLSGRIPPELGGLTNLEGLDSAATG